MITPQMDRDYKITPADNGNILDYGSAAAGTTVGVWGFDFVPDPSFVGSIQIVARGNTPGVGNNGVGFAGPVPFRAIYLNNSPLTASTAYGMSVATITDRSLVNVPCNGLDVGVLVACTAGFAYLYAANCDGSGSV